MSLQYPWWRFAVKTQLFLRWSKGLPIVPITLRLAVSFFSTFKVLIRWKCKGNPCSLRGRTNNYQIAEHLGKKENWLSLAIVTPAAGEAFQSFSLHGFISPSQNYLCLQVRKCKHTQITHRWRIGHVELDHHNTVISLWWFFLTKWLWYQTHLIPGFWSIFDK